MSPKVNMELAIASEIFTEGTGEFPLRNILKSDRAPKSSTSGTGKSKIVQIEELYQRFENGEKFFNGGQRQARWSMHDKCARGRERHLPL